jgi:hypothetical protein
MERIHMDGTDYNAWDFPLWLLLYDSSAPWQTSTNQSACYQKLSLSKSV